MRTVPAASKPVELISSDIWIRWTRSSVVPAYGHPDPLNPHVWLVVAQAQWPSTRYNHDIFVREDGTVYARVLAEDVFEVGGEAVSL